MTTADPREWLTAAQERAEMATEGPWANYSINPRITQEHSVYSVHLDLDEAARSSEVAGPVMPRNAEFIAAARTEHPAMAAALLAVLKLHRPVEVFDIDHVNGVWRLDADGERIRLANLCAECMTAAEKSDLEDGNWESSLETVNYPCPTVAVITDRLPGERP